MLILHTDIPEGCQIDWNSIVHAILNLERNHPDENHWSNRMLRPSLSAEDKRSILQDMREETYGRE